MRSSEIAPRRRPSTSLRMRGYENSARGDSSTGSELKAVEEACREAPRTVEPCVLCASGVNISSREPGITRKIARSGRQGEMGCWSNGVMERWSASPILQHLSWPALLHEALFLGVAGELCAAIDAELLIDVVEMDLDRSLADEELLADLHIAHSRVNFPGAYVRVF